MNTLSGAAEPFWSNRACDALGLVHHYERLTGDITLVQFAAAG